MAQYAGAALVGFLAAWGIYWILLLIGCAAGLARAVAGLLVTIAWWIAVFSIRKPQREQKRLVSAGMACGRCWGEFDDDDSKHEYHGYILCDECFFKVAKGHVGGPQSEVHPMLARLTDRFRIVMAFANREAMRLNHDTLLPVHILLGLIEENGGTAAQAFGALELDPNELQPEVEALAAATSTESAARAASKELLHESQAQADSLNHEYIGTGHLLLALVNKEGPLVTDAIARFGVSTGQLRETTLSVLGSNDPSEP